MERLYNVRSEKAMQKLKHELLGNYEELQGDNWSVFYSWDVYGRNTVIVLRGAYVLYDELEEGETVPQFRASDTISKETHEAIAKEINLYKKDRKNVFTT